MSHTVAGISQYRLINVPPNVRLLTKLDGAPKLLKNAFEDISHEETTADDRGKPLKANDVCSFEAAHPTLPNF